MFGLIRLTLALAALPVRVAMIPVKIAGRQLLRIPVVRRAADRAVRVVPTRLRGGGKKKGKGKGKGKGKKVKPDEARQNYLAARTPRAGETPGSRSSGGQGGGDQAHAQMMKMQQQQFAQQMKWQREQARQQAEWQRQNSISPADLVAGLTRLLASKGGSALDIPTLVQELAAKGVSPAVTRAALAEAHQRGWVKKAGDGRVAASAKSVRAHGVPADDLAQRRQRRVR